jgi:sugar phosphate isomerase/epimerase
LVGVKVANAPLSYGAFEMTVGTDFPVPAPARVLEAMAAAGYAGTELGPPGYLGDCDLGDLELVGGFVQIPFSDPDAGLEELHATLDRFAGAKTAERADTLTAWRRGLFCALGQGDVDLAAFCRAVEDAGYDGWVVVEQDRVLAGHDDFASAAADQVANREWLREHAGW